MRQNVYYYHFSDLYTNTTLTFRTFIYLIPQQVSVVPFDHHQVENTST